MDKLHVLFEEPIIWVKELGGLGSKVWEVKTEKEEVIVRTSAITNEDQPYLFACKELFGLKLKESFAIEEINLQISENSEMPVPKVMRKQIIDDQQYVVLEKVEGSHFMINNLPENTLFHFGELMAQVHKNSFNYYGDLPGSSKKPIEKFHFHMHSVMKKIIHSYYSSLPNVNKILDILDQSVPLILPKEATYILVDMDIRQFLLNGTKLSLVDTEAYVIAPRELDLIALEYSFTKEKGIAFKQGYSKVLPFPDLTNPRAFYRLFHGLLQIKGPVDLEKWVNQSIIW